MSDWKKIGLNVFEEWMEENPKGERRVSTPLGFLPEPSHKDIRWGRVSSSQDAAMVANALSYRHIFQSYKNISDASYIWTGKKSDPSFKLLVHRSMATRVWQATVNDVWTSTLPEWKSTLHRKGLNPWPLFIDIGLWKSLGLAKMTLNSFASWQKNNSHLFFIDDKKPSMPSIEIYDDVNKKKWWVSISNNTNKSSIFTPLKWHGQKPKAYQGEGWSDEYIPLSSKENNPSGYVDPVLNYAQSKAHPPVNAFEVIRDVSKALNIDGMVEDVLSYDQIDAVWIAMKQMKSGSFLLADETGYGKGRVLAALSIIAINKNYQVLFFTERKNLFSDFYRDLIAVDKNQKTPLPFLLHSSASITDPSGKKIKLNNKDNFDKSTWVWTTYSQFNRENKEKLSNICSWIKNKKTLLIMDEAQNAAGQSNTAKSMKKIQSSCVSVVFSSATFAKNEQQLLAYRSLFKGRDWEWERLKHAFASNNEILRSAITLLWASQGVYLRREHPPMNLPDPVWLSENSEIKKNEEIFSLWWNKALELSSQWLSIQNKQDGPWSKIGGMASRASREFSILQKQDFLAKQIKNSVDKNQKVVVVSDWILSSHVQRLVDNTKNKKSDINIENEEGVKIKSDLFFKEKPSWKKSWMDVFNETFSIEGFNENAPNVKKFREIQSQLNQILESLPDWSISPFDDLMSNLNDLNISCLEVSGRTWEMTKQDDEWRISSIAKKDRNTIISKFNNEKIDCILLTRAGNSGASLHAGKSFKDLKQRHLIEWDVSPDASVRLQFWGRVRRKDQVSEPQRSTILLDTNFERRRFNRDNTKQQKLLSHSGNAKFERGADYLGKDGDFIASQWLLLNPDHKRKVNQFYGADAGQLLSRSIVFDQATRDSLMSNLDTGVDLLGDWYPEKLNLWHSPSRSIRKKWWWGDGDSSLFWSDHLWEPRKMAIKEDILREIKIHGEGKSLVASDAFKIWSDILMTEFKSNPQSITPYHESMIKWWKKHLSLFERGMGISVIDPHTKGRANAIVLGWKIPRNPSFNNLNPTQIGIYLWICTMDKPILISLAACIDEAYAHAQPYARSASPSWFSGEYSPTKSLVLLGPAWSVASWGARSSPMGELIYLQDEFENYQWGWKMPSFWSWDDMMKSNRELASISHAREFIKDFTDPIFWRLSPKIQIKTQPQSNGLFVTGDIASHDYLSFNLLKKSGHPRWDSSRRNWSITIPWSSVSYAFNLWFGTGFIPTIEAKHLSWYKQTWKKFSPK